MSIPKLATGIAGFDEITSGGIPRERTTLVLGGPGTAKTIFALQTLVNGAKSGEPGIFIAFEEPIEQAREDASSFDWGAETLTDDNLYFLDAQLSPDVVAGGDFDLSGLLAMVAIRAKNMGASRVAFDGLDVLFSLLPDENAEKREIHRINEWLRANKLTGILTAKAGSVEPAIGTGFGFIQYASDCVVLLTNELNERVSARSLRVIKYRGSGHSTNQFAVIISDSGLVVEGFSTDELAHEPSDERISTGVDGLDEMLNGGYYRGSGVLISGVPGAAKTSISGAAAYVSCQRDEPVLFVSFEDSAEAMARNFRTIGLDFSPFIERGLMNFHAVRGTTFGTEQHVVSLKHLADRHNVKMMVIDPVTALMRSGGHYEASAAVIRLLDYSKLKGITLLVTANLSADSRDSEDAPLQISTMSDVWLHVNFASENGSRKRQFTILKARGTAHSDQLKRLIVSSDGIHVKDWQPSPPATPAD